MSDTLTFFHGPQTRSSGVAVLLHELGAPHEVHRVNIRAGEQRRPDYLAINPLGKVPAIRHGNALITEQVAIFIYLADLFPEAGLAPAIGDPLRGPYLRWIAFYGSCFEPAIVDRAMKRDPAPPSTSPYGTYEGVLDTVEAQLRPGPFMLGERLSAADILWGVALKWVTGFGLVPETPVIKAYVERITARPSVQAVTEQDAAFMAQATPAP